MKHTYQLRGMAFTLCTRTTISPRRWQPWTASTAVGYMKGRTRQKSKTFTTEASAKKHSCERQLHRGVDTCGSVQKLVFFQNYLGSQVNFSDSFSIRMPWENCFAVPNKQLPLVYDGAGVKAVLLCTSFGNRGSLLHGFARPHIDTRDNCPLLPMLLSHCWGNMVVRMRKVMAIPRSLNRVAGRALQC